MAAAGTLNGLQDPSFEGDKKIISLGETFFLFQAVYHRVDKIS